MAQHAALTLERWSRFTLDQQVLMIANEMNRGSKFVHPSDGVRRRNAYERALALVDLTIGANSAHGLRRELLRWRDLLAALYADAGWCPEAHAAAFRALLRLTPETSRQLPHISAAGAA